MFSTEPRLFFRFGHADREIRTEEKKNNANPSVQSASSHPEEVAVLGGPRIVHDAVDLPVGAYRGVDDRSRRLGRTQIHRK